MSPTRMVVAACLIATANVGVAATAHADGPAPVAIPDVAVLHEPHLLPPRHPGDNAASTAPQGSGNLTNHGGPVMVNANPNDITVHPIYWGSTATSLQSNVGAGLDAVYKGYSGSTYAGISSQYSNTATTLTVLSGVTDTTTANSQTSKVLQAVQRAISNSKVTVSTGNDKDYYPVYTDLGRNGRGYCAWHSYGTVTDKSNVKHVVEFAFFFNLNGDPGCAVANVNSYSQQTQNLANVTAHELAEALTDPHLDAWYDAAGYENGDKCAWYFDPVDGKVTLGGTDWAMQGEYNNKNSNCLWG